MDEPFPLYTEASFTCNKAYYITTGPSTRICGEWRNWSGMNPTCSLSNKINLPNFVPLHARLGYFSFFLNYQQHEVGVFANYFFPFISFVKFVVVTHRWKMLPNLLINYYVLNELICQDKYNLN